MIVLLTCGVCGMVETAHGAGFGPSCPRCGSRDIDAIELPVRAAPVVFAPFMPPFLCGPGQQMYDVVASKWGLPLRRKSELGGTFVPLSRSA